MKTVFRVFLVVGLMVVGSNVWAAEGEKQAAVCGCENPLRLTDGLSRFKLKDFELNLHMRLQAWGGWVQDEALLSNGDRIEQPGFRMRRARFGFSGQLFKNLEYELELDLFDKERTGGPLYEAYVKYTPFHFIGASVGVQKFIFMQSEIMSSGYLPHLDRAVGAYAMSPGNSLGLMLFSEPWKDHLTLSAAVYNGQRRTESFYTGYDGVGVTLGNRFDGMSYAGRLDLVPMEAMGKGMADPGQGDDFRLAMGGGAFWNVGGSMDVMGYSAYVHMKFKGVHLFGEYARDKSSPSDKPSRPENDSAEMERWTMNASLGYVFLKDMLGAAVRFEMLDSNMSVDDEGDEWLVAGTVTYYIIGDFLKAQVEYSHREEMHGQATDNDAVLGGVQIMF